jgi:hypothetical protein
MKTLKAQINIETSIIIFVAIIITVLTIFIMIKTASLNPSSSSIPVHLISLDVNQTTAIVFASSYISNPKSLSIEYKGVNSSNTLAFSFLNCNFTQVKTIGVLGEYVFHSNTLCNFSAFKGTYEIFYAFYFNNGVETAIPIENKIFGFASISQPYYAKLLVSPQVITYNNSVLLKITTNINNATYSIKINNYPVQSCQNIKTSNSCSVLANSYIGVSNSIAFYNVSATVYNASLTENVNNYFVVNPN